MPAIAYVLDMNHRTHGVYGVNEVILASALAAIVFPIFGCQPLTFVGVTGLINLCNYTMYNITVHHWGFDQIHYLRFQAWMLIWSAGFQFLVAVFNICDFTRFITDMTSQTFGFYVGVVYVQKGIELLIEEFEPAPRDNATGWLSVTIAILFTISVYLVTAIGRTSFLPFRIRTFLGSYAFIAGCIFWTGFSHFPQNSLKEVPLQRVPTSPSWFPTMDRGWFVDFWHLDVKWVFVAAPFGFLVMLLFYFDHNVSSVMAQARQFPVRTPAGFHFDMAVLAATTLVSGFLGLPAPNGLVPQAPEHTDSLSVYQQVDQAHQHHQLTGEPLLQQETELTNQELNQIRSRQVDDAVVGATLAGSRAAPQEIQNVRVVEQRASHLAIGALTLATMTRPFLVCLGLMPRAVFAGVFILVGWGSIEQNHLVQRLLALIQDRSMADPLDPLLRVRRRKIFLFTAIQWLFFGMTIGISQTLAGLGFPVLITLLIPVRYYIIPRLFTPPELTILDSPTADAPAVLSSLGHEPERVTGLGVEVAVDTGLAGTEWGKGPANLAQSQAQPTTFTSGLQRYDDSHTHATRRHPKHETVARTLEESV